MFSLQTHSGYKIIQLLSGRSNVFLLSNGKNNILIDCGVSRKGKTLYKRLKSLNINRLDCLLLTHSHYDHTGNTTEIRNNYGAKVFIHRSEAAELSEGRFQMPKGTNFFTNLVIYNLGKLILPFLKFKKHKFDILIDDYYDLKEYGFKAYLMHTPGHSGGSVSIIVDDEIALVGDTMFGVFKWSVFPPYADSPKQMIESWGKLLKTNCKIFLASHGTFKSRELLEKCYEKKSRKFAPNKSV